MRWSIVQGDALDRLREMPAESVQCVVTSPPYWGLRDYGTASWEGGDAGCDHRHPAEQRQLPHGDGRTNDSYADNRILKAGVGASFKETCGKCGARRIDAQLGLERTPEEYVAKMVEVFREVRRVLRKDGTLWLNLGDSYASTGRSDRKESPGVGAKQEMAAPGRDIRWKAGGGSNFSWTLPGGQKPKDLIGIPWRVAFALQADGWWLRSDIIWSKPNPMPESVTDRPTKAHEYVFLLTKSERYFFDQEAVKVPASADTHARYARGRSTTHKWADGGPGDQTIAKSFEHMRAPGVHPKSAKPGSGIKANESFSAAVKDIVGERNIRSVWTIATQPFPEAHFATFPEKLVEPCVKAGSRVGDTVLDPFAGSGTVGVVALRLGRSFLGIELKPEYAEMARHRIMDDAPLLNTAAE